MSPPPIPPHGTAPAGGSTNPSSPSPLPTPGAVSGVSADPPTPVVLPDKIPQSWLDQVRNETKSDRTSFLTSVVLPIAIALISAAAAVFTTYAGIKASGDLELKKARVADCQADSKVTLASYELLGSNLSQLLQQFDGLETLAQIARSQNALRNPKDAANIRSGIEKLGEQIRAVLALKNDAHIDAKVGDRVDNAINGMRAAIQDTDLNLTNFSAASVQTESDLKAAIDVVQKARVGISTNGGCYNKL